MLWLPRQPVQNRKRLIMPFPWYQVLLIPRQPVPLATWTVSRFVLFHKTRCYKEIDLVLRAFSVYSMVDGSRQRFFRLAGGKKIKKKQTLGFRFFLILQLACQRKKIKKHQMFFFFLTGQLILNSSEDSSPIEYNANALIGAK